MKKRILAVMTAAVMIITLLPATAYADEEQTDGNGEKQTVEADPENSESQTSDDTGDDDASDENGSGDTIGNDTEENGDDQEEAAAQVTVKLNTSDHTKYMDGKAGLFYPKAALSRAEAAQMIYSLLQTPSESDVIQSAGFSDVPDGAWYADAVNNLASYGVLTGNNGLFRPDANVSRAEFLTMLSKFSEPAESSVTFSDVPANHWAYSMIASAAEKGWVSGYEDGTFHPDGTIKRAEAVAIVNRILDRSADAAVLAADDDIRFFPDVETSYWAYNDIMEAAVSHEYSKDDVTQAETWTSFTRENKTSMTVGLHVINGALYCVKSDGTFACNETVDGHTYDSSHRYTTGNTGLDNLMRSATAACVNSNMTQREMLRAAFNYMVNNFSYLKRNTLSTGAKGWTEEYAVPMFEQYKGNCYSFAAAYYYLAKNIGYNPVEVAGLVGHNRRPHGWIEIAINGTTYIYDTELTMAKRKKGLNYDLFEMTYKNAPFIYAKS